MLNKNTKVVDFDCGYRVGFYSRLVLDCYANTIFLKSAAMGLEKAIKCQ